MRIIAAIFAVFVLAATLPVLAASHNDAPPRDAKLYDRSGRYQGRVTSDGHGQARSYDKSGRYQGKAVRQGKSIKLYDKSGRYVGRVEAR